MEKDYTKEQLWKIFAKLPEDLKDAIFSEKTSDDIYNICQRNGLAEEKISEVARLTGNVMLGILPIEKFRNSLKQELGFKKDIAEKIGFQIERIIFFPIKNELDEIYKMKTAPKVIIKEKTEKTGRDVYRETVE